jgi:hypothetical protein
MTARCLRSPESVSVAEANFEQFQLLLGHVYVERTKRYLECKQRLRQAGIKLLDFGLANLGTSGIPSKARLPVNSSYSTMPNGKLSLRPSSS